MREMGDGALNLPYQEQDATQLDMSDGEFASGVVMMGAVIGTTHGPKPAIVFRFSRGDGTFYPPRVLVAEPREIQALKTLTRDAVDTAVAAAHRSGAR